MTNLPTEIDAILDILANGAMWCVRSDQTINGKQLSKLKSKAKQAIALELQTVEKAYGSCHKCYGKGYASVRHGETYRGKTTNMRTDIKYCTCERGKQLEELSALEINKARQELLDTVNSATIERRHNPLTGENIDLIDKAELLAALQKEVEG